MKSAAVRLLLRLSGYWLRNRWIRAGKMAVWDRLCVPHLSWRNEEIVCKTVEGSRFRVRPTDFVENRICFFGRWEPACPTSACDVLFVKPGSRVIQRLQPDRCVDAPARKVGVCT